jgi:hypothetical protein
MAPWFLRQLGEKRARATGGEHGRTRVMVIGCKLSKCAGATNRQCVRHDFRYGVTATPAWQSTGMAIEITPYRLNDVAPSGPAQG